MGKFWICGIHVLVYYPKLCFFITSSQLCVKYYFFDYILILYHVYYAFMLLLSNITLIKFDTC